VLLERSTESQRLQRSFHDAEQGHGRVAALLGEAGVGKTSLAESFARDVADRARVLRSACEDLAISDPLGPLRDLAREADAALSQDPRAQEPREASPVHRFSQALRVFADGERPTVVVVEDIHWADDATLDFVRFIGRRVSRTRILMILTSRNESSESRKRVRRALADIAPNVLVRIEVPLLSLEAVAELARDSRTSWPSGRGSRASTGRLRWPACRRSSD
jgi:predicted ATPase